MKTLKYKIVINLRNSKPRIFDIQAENRYSAMMAALNSLDGLDRMMFESVEFLPIEAEYYFVELEDRLQY